MNKEIGDLSWFLVTCAVLFVLLGMFMPGCGDEPAKRQPSEEPRVEIICDETVCTILAWNVTYVQAYYDGKLEWYADVSADRRATFREEAPDRYLLVVACNGNECIELRHDIKLAQLDEDDECGDDPLCPLEYAQQTCRTVCNTLPWGEVECVTICEEYNA